MRRSILSYSRPGPPPYPIPKIRLGKRSSNFAFIMKILAFCDTVDYVIILITVIEKNTWARLDTQFLSSVKLHISGCLIYKHAKTTFLTISRGFMTHYEDFRRFSKSCPMATRTCANIFLNFRRLPKIS